MRVALLNHGYTPTLRTPQALLDRFDTLVGWAEALRAEGAEVRVFQRYFQDAVVEQSGVTYAFVKAVGASLPQKWHIPLALHRQVQAWRPDIIHFNSLLFPLIARHLASLLPTTPMVIQHHAERPPTGWRRWLSRWGLARAAAFFFTACEQGEAWRTADILRPHQRIFAVMEGSTTFRPLPRGEARQQTGLTGAPLFLWIGRLMANKDPLTVLEGLTPILTEMPTARLAMLYHERDLLPQVQTWLAMHPALAHQVILVGQVPHATIPAWLSSADYFVLGSHYEGGGYALVEAMACGLVPLITDIPSFRRMTNGGKVGALWRVGDADSLTRATRGLLARDWNRESARTQAQFAEQLSYPAIGRDAMAAYRTVLA